MAKQGTFSSLSSKSMYLQWTRRIRPWHVVITVVLCVAAYIFSIWWASPEHRMAQFVAAVNSNSPTGLLNLASDDEVLRLGLTPAKIRGLITDASLSPAGIQLIDPTKARMNDMQFRYNRAMLYDLTDRQGHLLVNPDGQTARVYLVAYNSPSGWHIALSKFIAGVSSARGPHRYADICRRNGVPTEIFEPANASWQELGK